MVQTVGEAVTAGDSLVEIETEDETIEVQAPTTGVLSEIFLLNGQYLQAGALLGIMTEYGKA